MGRVRHKVLWGLLGLGAAFFMIGFGSCAALGFVYSAAMLAEISSGYWPLSVMFAVPAVLGIGLAWGSGRLAFYCYRQMKARTPDDTGKAELP